MSLTKRSSKGSALTYTEVDDNFTHLGGDGTYQFPSTDGSADHVLATNGSGQLSFVNQSGIAGPAHINLTGDMNGQTFQGHAGKRLLDVSSSPAQITIDGFIPATSDLGKSWTIINASPAAGHYVKLNFDSVYMRFLSGNTTQAKQWDWRINPGGIAEIVCIGTSTGTANTPSFLIYGAGIGED